MKEPVTIPLKQQFFICLDVHEWEASQLLTEGLGRVPHFPHLQSGIIFSYLPWL